MQPAALEQATVAEAEPAAAPKFRRILAWLTDLIICTVLSMLAVGFFGFFAPPETAGGLVPMLLIGFACAMAYLGYATPVIGNSVGKWLFGLRIVAHERGQRVSFAQWTVRLLVGMFWPINAIGMLASDTGRHFGDRAAQTRVVLARPARSFWIGLVGAIVVSVVAFKAASAAMKLSMINSSACKTARAHLAEQHPSARVAAFPSGFQLINDEAMFDFRVGDEWGRVILQREHGGSWRVARSGTVDEPITGVAISFGASGD